MSTMSGPDKLSDRKYRGCLNKKRFTTRRHAQNAVARYTKRFSKPFRLYHCPDCNAYHVTTSIK